MVLVGGNPMKEIKTDRKACDVTVATIVYIPELSGYWEESLETLKLCLASIIHNTGPDFDLMVFDNGSCQEVCAYLLDLHAKGLIQYLILSDGNVGKPAAMNVLFGAAPGKYVAFTDSDVLFRPGWLEASIAVFEAFPRVGMVSGRPWRPIRDITFEQVAKNRDVVKKVDGVEVQEGDLIPREYLEEHARSLGSHPIPELKPEGQDLKITRNGITVYGFGSHFQFVTTADVIKEAGPLAVADVGLWKSVRSWDERICELAYLRLALDGPYVKHLGNTLEDENVEELESAAGLQGSVQRRHHGHGRSLLTRILEIIILVPFFKRCMKRLHRHMYEALSVRKR